MNLENQNTSLNNELEGIVVLDFCKLLPGPLATKMLAQRGATVYKIEDPSSPDSIRFFPPFEGEKSLFDIALNAHKKELSVAFRSAVSDKLVKLIKNADVLVEQFRPGVMEAFNLGYENVKKINASIIYVSITGYGQKGKYASEPGHDLNYLARSGVLSQFKDQDGAPIVPAVQVADIHGGAFSAFQEILLALIQTQKTGTGKFIDINMTGNATNLLTLPALHQQGSGDESSFVLNGRFINYNIYQSKDGVYFALGALEPKFWINFCKHIQQPDWEDRLLSDRTSHIDELTALFRKSDSDYWRKIEAKGDACLTEVLSMTEARSRFPDFWGQTKGGKHIPQ